MKVLLITFSDNADHQDITFSMFESIKKTQEQNVDIWVMGIKEPKAELMKSSHAKLVNCPKRPGIEKKTFDVFELHSIIKWIKKQHFDAIFFESLHVWNLAIMLRCHKNTRIYQMIHDLIPHKGDKQAKSVHLMNKAVCKMADYIVLCNKKYVPKVTQIYGVSPERVKYVDMWRRFPEYTQPTYSKHVLFFGRMNPYKGVENLLEIAKECSEIQFDVVGRVDPLVEDAAQRLKELPNVNMNNGYVTNEEMENAFINADWVVLPYKSATQSGVVIDGYRYSRPSLAFNVGAISEQIENGVSGYLIKPGDNKAFIERLRESLQMDKEKYAEFSRSSYEYGVKKYGSIGAIDRFINLVSE